MKNLKKVLALVLAFACAFTMMAGAVVYPDVPAGSEYSEAITMLSDLGVITGDTDGKYHPENTITRAEACALIARLLTGETDVSKYQGASNFPDVAKTSWYESAVGYCVANGIVRGYPDGTFRPAVQITDAEFVTMLVRAMGYETVSNPLSYPYGYISAAQTAGLLDDVTVVPASGALRGEDAQMLYNAMFADFARGARFINTTHGTTVEEYPTIAESVFGLTRAAAGTWDDEDDELDLCKAHTWVIVGTIHEKDFEDMAVAIPIADGETELYTIKNDVPRFIFNYEGDVESLIGYQVELWGEGQHSEPEYNKQIDGYFYSDDWNIKAVKTVSGQTAYKYTPADDELPVDVDDVQALVIKENGDRTGTWDEKGMDVEDELTVKNSAQYNLFDWDSDGSADYVDGLLYNYYKVESVSSKTVRLYGFNDKLAYTLDKDGETDVDDVTIKADVEDLEEGDYIQVSVACESTKKDSIHTWTIEVVEPTTVEVTKVSSTKGVYFDDELIEVADAKSGNPQYYFEGTGETRGTYYTMNENSEDNWDVYLDANGFIIYLTESDSNWTGYMFVTGAAQGNNKNTGSRRQALISGKTETNEVLTDVEIAKNAVIRDSFGNDIYDSSEYHFATFGNEDLVPLVGRVFRYIYDEDSKEITRMEMVASDAWAADYSYNEDTEAVTINANEDRADGVSGNYWLFDADVIFVVDPQAIYDDWDWDGNVGSAFYGLYEYDFINAEYSNVATHCWEDGVGIVGDPTGETWDIDPDYVIAVDYTEIPDISRAAQNESNINTYARGITFDLDATKDLSGAVLMGVDNFDYFTNTSTKVALMTELVYSARNDNYEFVGYVAGEDETVETVTVDADDFKLNGQDADKDAVDAICGLLNNNNANDADDKNGMYVELKFNKDGKVTAMNIISETEANDVQYNVADDDAVNPTYTVVRAVVNRHSNNKYLMLTNGMVLSDDGTLKIQSIRNSGYTSYGKITDDTAFFEIDGQPRMVAGQLMNAYEDAFDSDLDVTIASDADLTSFITNLDDEYSDEYIVADVILDSKTAGAGDDIVAIYAYSDYVKEYDVLDGDLKLNNRENLYSVDYATQDVDATVTCADSELNRNRVYVEVTKVVDNKTVYKSDDAHVDTVFAIPTLDEGNYTVTAYGYNVAAGKYQPIDSAELQIAPTLITANLDVNEKTYQSVIVSNVNVPAAKLSKDNFRIYVNSTLLVEGADYDYRYDDVTNTYNFLLTKTLSAGDEVKAEIVGVANYIGWTDTVEVEAAPAEIPTVTSAVASIAASDKVVVTIGGNNVREFMDPDMWTATWDGNEYEVTRVTFDDSTNTLTLTIGENSQGDKWSTINPGDVAVELLYNNEVVSDIDVEA